MTEIERGKFNKNGFRLSAVSCQRQTKLKAESRELSAVRYAPMWILQNAETETTFRLRPGAVKTVGRAPRADFMLDAALVSRLHCRITATTDKLEVVDLKSTNGTFVNDKRVQKAHLKSGDRLRLGRAELTVEKTKT